MEDIRDRILRAAALIYAEAGFRGTTTRRVAQAAEVNEITLFRHFGTKEGLVKAALHAAHRQANPVVLTDPVDPEAELYAWAWSTYRHWQENRGMICRVMGDLVEHPELAPDFCKEPGCEHAMVSHYLTRMREQELATGSFVPEAAAGLLLGSIFTHAMWRDHFSDPDLPPAEQVIRQFVVLLLNAVGFRAAVTRKSKEIA
jgi:AcrR family transcriptional regulator